MTVGLFRPYSQDDKPSTDAVEVTGDTAHYKGAPSP